MVTKIQTSEIKDWNQDGVTDKKDLEWLLKQKGVEDLSKEEIEFDGKTFSNLEAFGKSGEFQGVAQNAEAAAPSEKAQKELDGIQLKMDELVAEINKAKQQNASDAIIKQTQAALQKEIDKASKLLMKSGSDLDLMPYKKAAGTANAFSGKAQMTAGGQAPSGGKAQTYSGTGGVFTPPSNWGAQTLGGSMPMFSSDAYMKTMAMEDNIMNSWDAVNRNTSRGKQLMMLFFYFARMAESGSMDAMYQFMKFITYIISKDKAKQQIEMGKKLIQLQELSRSWTNKLLNVNSNSTDPAASNELMKTMTIVKSETDAIATSQKLISQMMEEFAQVVETLTNTTKAALETAGRIKRTVSTMR